MQSWLGWRSEILGQDKRGNGNKNIRVENTTPQESGKDTKHKEIDNRARK